LAVACLALGALLPFAHPSVAEEPSAPPERTLYADVAGRVVDDATGAPLGGVVVSLLYEAVVTDAEGNFTFNKIPLVHTTQVSLRISNDDGLIIGCTTFDVPVRFYPVAASDGDKVGIVVADPSVDTNIEIRLKSVPVGEVVAFCSGCHVNNPCVETSTFQSVVKSGKDLKGIVVKESELEKYRDELMQKGLAKDSYMKIRYQDTHPDGMDIFAIANGEGDDSVFGLFQVPQGLKLHVVTQDDVEHHYVVCDTCHARHQPTPQRQFVVLPFDDDSQLCYKCHR